MYNFHFAKVIAGVGPMLAKETVLSKIVNMVDIFRISLSQGFDDNNKKYIETVLKLDNSKTIMLETRGTDVRVKNLTPVTIKKNDEIVVDYSEYAQENDKKVFVDYARLGDVPVGTRLEFVQSKVVLEVTGVNDDNVTCKIIDGGTIVQYDKVMFQNYAPDSLFLTDRDKKDILRGLEHGIHIVAGSNTKSHEDIMHMRTFLSNNNAERLKVFAKVESTEAVKNIDKILDSADGVILIVDKIQDGLTETGLTVEDIITKAKEMGTPIVMSYIREVHTDKYPLIDEKTVKHYCGQGVDGYMVETMIDEEDPLRIVTPLFEMLTANCMSYEKRDLARFYEESDFIIRDYIIYNAYRITQELDVKAIVCYTANGYTTARLSSLNPSVPIIAFSSVDETYRYINTLRGVKGYKISPTFDYENLKRIGKEMIRIIFKGNISLDDKVVIVQANELNRDEKTDMINGVELYKFKNI